MCRPDMQCKGGKWIFHHSPTQLNDLLRWFFFLILQHACYCLEACLKGGEVFFFYDIGLAAVLEALHVQPGLTGSRGVCDELPAYRRALGNKHGVAGRD